jgi:hypothetical protein
MFLVVSSASGLEGDTDINRKEPRVEELPTGLDSARVNPAEDQDMIATTSNNLKSGSDFRFWCIKRGVQAINLPASASHQPKIRSQHCKRPR